MPPKKTSTSEAPAMTQAAIRKLVVDNVSAALIWKHKPLTWQILTIPPDQEKLLIDEAYKITWVEFKKLLIKKYCPRTKVQKMEDEFYHLTMKGNVNPTRIDLSLLSLYIRLVSLDKSK
ncbi:hypothetical protein Tco_0186571, partial [Tanacetum coccineum]